MPRRSFRRSQVGFVFEGSDLRLRFSLGLRDIEERMAARGIDVSYETIRCWTIKFGPQIARRLRKLRPSPSPHWHLDEVVCSICAKRMYLWRAVDDEGDVLDLVVDRRRDTEAALKLLKRLLRTQPVAPERIVTDGLGSYPAALGQLGLRDLHSPGRLRENNWAETHICRYDDVSDSSSCSNHKLRPSISSLPTQRFTTPSTPRDTLVSQPTLRRFRAGTDATWAAAVA